MEQQDTPRLRASDAEREQVVSMLRHAMSEGRLSLAEGEERMATAYASTFRDELPPLTADLPPKEHTAARSAPGTGAASEGTPAGAGGQRGYRRRRPPLPALWLAGLAAVAAGVFALTVGRPLWPAIVLGTVALILIKRGCCRSA